MIPDRESDLRKSGLITPKEELGFQISVFWQFWIRIVWIQQKWNHNTSNSFMPPAPAAALVKPELSAITSPSSSRIQLKLWVTPVDHATNGRRNLFASATSEREEEGDTFINCFGITLFALGTRLLLCFQLKLRLSLGNVATVLFTILSQNLLESFMSHHNTLL